MSNKHEHVKWTDTRKRLKIRRQISYIYINGFHEIMMSVILGNKWTSYDFINGDWRDIKPKWHGRTK